MEREYYKVIIDQAIEEADALGIEKITFIEFGVYQGKGLLEVCRYLNLRDLTDMVRVVGFDSFEGLPKPTGRLDCPYLWQEGQFDATPKDVETMLGSHEYELVIGNVFETLRSWECEYPIGAISFDLDFYSSTVGALDVFVDKPTMPRVYCYFDDLHTIDSLGVRRAIREFRKTRNAMGQYLEQSYAKEVISSSPSWNWKIYEYHNSQHKLYLHNVKGVCRF